ncbi:enoyl-CoA hydratase/isomerase family protein [Streptomyces asoensis]|uniref:Enoyl-CoA hydratase/isomerase family protein n=1 Tax=Streptomyces asoensis TaxID=249586 RepID=A0A6M4WZ91_9ACTN|nr:enoyl-CoA hydratase/isomerase family protein [Streptomyces asoensis]QJT05252.1 enoyl-CoA hydratase/isomerase family protein [Streptomyces asoensis]
MSPTHSDDPLHGDEGLMLRSDGRVGNPVRCLVLDDWHDVAASRVEAEAARLADSLPLTFGIATRQPPDRLRPLLEALTLTLAAPQVGAEARELVTVHDPLVAFDELARLVGRHPRASLVLGQLLRQTPRLGTLQGLAAEAAAYSMLLGGTEFASWLADRGTPGAAPEEGPLVRVRRENDRLSVLLDRPRRRNAFSFRMREELFEALELALLDGTVDRVELAGAGTVFSSGGDLSEFGTATDLVAACLVRLDRAPWRLIDRMRDRVTVRVQGAAVGAGLEMAAFAGRLVSSPGAFFQLPEVAMGLVPGAGGTVSVPRRIGRWRAAWMMLSGARLDATTALRWGLIDEIAETDETDDGREPRGAPARRPAGPDPGPRPPP